MSRTCPLCTSPNLSPWFQDANRHYNRCGRCRLVSVPPEEHLSLQAEKAEYDLHENEISDPGYRRFLKRLAEPLLSHLAPASVGLDFGCGPGPALATMLEEAGHTVCLYDPCYVPDRSVLKDRYDFVTASEVVEHLRQPGGEMNRLWACLKPGGWLGVMTKQVEGLEAFGRWHYKNDPTHICFWSKETFAWLAGEWSARTLYIGKDVVLLTKESGE